MAKKTITMFVEETVTIRKEVTVEYDSSKEDFDSDADSAEQLLRREFSSGLSGAFTNGYEIINSDGLNFFLTEEDANNNKATDPNEVLETNANEIEVTGGVIAFDEDDGTIRYTDDYGNTEGVWTPGEAEYKHYKEMYFPNHEVKEVVEDDE